MYNEDVIDLYDRTTVGTKVVVTAKKFVTASAIMAANDNGFSQDVFSASN